MLQHTSITDVCTAHTPHLLQQLDTGSFRPRVFWTSNCLSGLSACSAVCNASGNDQQLIPEGRENVLLLVCVPKVMHSANPCSACMQKSPGMELWLHLYLCLFGSQLGAGSGAGDRQGQGQQMSCNLQWSGTLKIWSPSLQNLWLALLK